MTISTPLSKDDYFIDSHCHLDRYANLPEILTNAAGNGVSHCLSVCVSRDNFDKVLPIARDNAGVFASVGIHPCEKIDHSLCPEELSAWLTGASQEPKVVALGETGLDFLPTSPPQAYQEMVFQSHINSAIATGLPLIVHLRNGESEFLSMMEKVLAKNPVRGVMHCFTGSLHCAKEVLSWGWMISLSGIVTFPNARALQDIVPQIPITQLLVETDAPWLAPQPYRGQQNQPAYVISTGTYVADLLGLPVTSLARHTSHNFFSLFTKAQDFLKEVLMK